VKITAKIVLISTYELGRQPFGLASPAAWLRKRGHAVVCRDLARQDLDESSVRAADLIAIYLPMHTATRLAAELLPALRTLNPEAHLCCYGLYAPMNEKYLRSLGVETILGGEFESGLVHLVERLSGRGANANRNAAHENGSADTPSYQAVQEEPLISLERLAFEVPDRSGMPALQKYAHLIIPGDGFRIVGSTEASRGCKHRCRHCPIVPVYNGVFRVVPREIVLEDVRRQVAAGAQHISFGDPDFFNGIGHALPLVEEFHREFPEVTYDVTIKIEHLKKYEDQISKLQATGCLFVISAVESVDDAVLVALDKGHTRADFLHVVKTLRALDLVLHPTLVPFSPWTTLQGYLDLLRVLAEQGLTENVAPIQLGIRLLIPEGSRMLELEDIRRVIEPFDAKSLAYPWKNADPRVDELSTAVQEMAAAADRQKLPRTAAFEQIWKAAHRAAGVSTPEMPTSAHPTQSVPFLSEPWYCCAEPTPAQLVSIGPQPAANKTTVTAESFV
jgi:radical SAM superfamily enzyme YgiQ (UPF0313 family)